MNGDIVNLGDGRKSSPTTQTAGLIRDAKARLPAHDPFQPVLDAMASLVRLIEDTAALAGRPLLSADAERKLVERLAQDILQAVYASINDARASVRRTMTAWIATGIAGVAILASTAVGFGVHMVDTREADARMQAARIDVPSVFGSLPLGEAAAWAKLIRENPPIGKVMATVKPYLADGGSAVSLPLWVVPSPKQAAPATPATPAAH